MTVDEKIKEQSERLEKVLRWPSRIKKLRHRKKNPMKESEFCRKHKLHTASFNRQKNGVSFPVAKTVARVEAAFAKEGV